MTHYNSDTLCPIGADKYDNKAPKGYEKLGKKLPNVELVGKGRRSAQAGRAKYACAEQSAWRKLCTI